MYELNNSQYRQGNCQSLVSVVMATYNGAQFLRKQIESILNQSYTNFELIIVDDGSTDETLSIVKEYAAINSRLQLYPADSNLGLVANFERGLNLTKGEYIAFSDQDDIFHHDKLETLVRKLEEKPLCDLVVSDLKLIDTTGNDIAQSMWRYHKSKPMSGKPFHRLILSNFATGCAMMFRRRLLELALPFPPDIVVHDWWLAIVAASHKANGITLVDRPLIDYRQHGSNVVGAKPLVKINLKTIFGFLRIPAFLQGILDDTKKQWEVELRRAQGYMIRNDIWDSREADIIDSVRQMYEGLCQDTKATFWQRLSLLPQRIKHSARTRRPRTCLKIIFVTLWPGSS